MAGFSALLLAVAGCSSASGAADGGFTQSIDTLAGGTVIVHNEGPLDISGKRLWHAREDLRIGGDGPGQQFGRIIGFEVDRSGNVYVADYQAEEVPVFRPDGSYSHTTGRRGSGPGEFEGIWGLRWDVAGNLWVLDSGLGRYSVFAPEGALRAMHRTPFVPAGGWWVGRVEEGGTILEWSFQAPWPARDGRWTAISGSADPSAYLYHPIRVSFEPVTLDTFPAFQYHIEPVDGHPRTPKPYSRRRIFHVDDHDAIWFAESTAYRITRRTLAGDTTLIFTMPARPERVSADERATAAREWIAPRRIPLDQVKDEQPVLEALTTDEDGRIYVFPHMDGVPVGTAMDVFDSSGTFLARVRIPVSTGLTAWPVTPLIRGEYLYGMAQDELDVQYVVRLRIFDAQGSAGRSKLHARELRYRVLTPRSRGTWHQAGA